MAALRVSLATKVAQRIPMRYDFIAVYIYSFNAWQADSLLMHVHNLMQGFLQEYDDE